MGVDDELRRQADAYTSGDLSKLYGIEKPKKNPGDAKPNTEHSNTGHQGGAPSTGHSNTGHQGGAPSTGHPNTGHQGGAPRTGHSNTGHVGPGNRRR